MYTIQQIAAAINSDVIINTPENAIQYLSTDSRRIAFPSAVLFFAIETRQRNGHQFIEEAYKRGVINFVVHTHFNTAAFTEANFIVTDNTLKALQQTAAFHRQHFAYPVIGITGSNGKTIVKEWLYQLLQDDFNIVKSPKSYNSQIGVPLSVWLMNSKHQLAIFEAGISEPAEMANLFQIIKPTIGIFTNIGEAHSEGFINQQQKVSEKMELFKKADILFFNADDKLIAQAVALKFTGDTFSYGFHANATLRLRHVRKTTFSTTIAAMYKEEVMQITIPFTDDASIQNAISCWCVMLYFGKDGLTIAERMLKLHAVDMRLQLKQAINGCYLINDAYSLDISSLSMALDFLVNQNQLADKTVILSDLPKGNDFYQYQQIAQTLAEKKVGRVILIGADWEKNLSLFQGPFNTIEHYSSTQSFIAQFNQMHFRNEIILLKGARAFEFEKIALLFDIKVHQTLMEIHLDAMVHNLNEHRKLLKPSTKLMAMVKAFGYGSGSAEIANLLQFHKVDYLAVAYADEGVELRKAGISLPILVLNIDEAAFNSIVDYSLEPEIFSFTALNSFSDFLLQQGLQQYPVHIKVDTGMHRLGFEEEDMDALTANLRHNQQIIVQSVFSHFAASEDEVQDNFTQQQFDIFQRCCGKIQEAVGYNFIRHIGNSAAIFRHPQMQLDMVRLGIGLYGVDVTKHLNLRPVTHLKTTIAQIKHLHAGDTVGYNRRGKIEKDAVTATIRIGYADGYRRELSNGKGKVFVNGCYAPVIGTICMDMCMIDITGIPDVKEDDVVELIGSHVSVESVAAACNTIAYEILTGIGQRVKRIYIEQ